MAKGKFMLIREIGMGLWNEIHHVLTQLIIAEIMHRIPVIYWGKGSLYAPADGSNAFEQFFLPVSGFGVRDIQKDSFTFSPGCWNASNLLSSNPKKAGMGAFGVPLADAEISGVVDTDFMPTDSGNRLLSKSNNAVTSRQNEADGGQEPDCLLECDAEVCVRDTYIDVEKVIPLIPKGHPLCGLSRRDLFCRLIRKYIRLREDVQSFVDEFYNSNMRGATFLAAHVRSSDKAAEVRHLHELNSRYRVEIEKILKANPGMRLFLMTDGLEILEEYKKRYGNLLVHTDCRRVHKDGQGVHYLDYPDNRLKGLEIIRDTWLASRCDFFVGNGYSHVSAAVSELKDWEEGSIKLLY